MSQIGNGHHPTGIPRVVADCLVPLIENVPNLVPVFFSRVSRAYCQVDGLSLAAFDVGYVRKYSPESRDHLRRLCAYIGVLRSGRVVPRAGDTLLILGGGWHDERRHRYLFGRSAALCRTIWFCHDLIPVLDPQFDVQGEVFARWLDAALRRRNEFICAPRFVEADLRNYALQRGADVRISIIPLAHEFRPIDGSVSPAVARAASGAMVLCVGSIVERKRQLNLAQVWARLHEEFGDRLPVLVMAGALIDAGALTNFLQGTADVGGKVALLGHVSDPELAFLYERCSFTVYPSLNEGWGLPVGESLWMENPVSAPT